MTELRAVPPEEVETWYTKELCTAFTPCEQKPLSAIRELMAQGRYELLGLYDGPLLQGYATLWSGPECPGYVLLDYLGVTAARRNGGLGGRMLGLLRERCGSGTVLIVEAEAPDSGGPPEERPLRERRLAFYRRHGCTPVYLSFNCSLLCQVFVLGEAPADLAALGKAHRAIYGPARTDVVIDPPPGAIPPQPYWMGR